MKQLGLIALLMCGIALTLNAQVPVTVVSGASFKQLEPVAPGAYAQAFGNYQGFPTAQAGVDQLPLPTEIQGIQLTIEGATSAANLYAVRPDVVAFIVPQELAPGQHTLRVLNGGQVIGEGTISVAGVFPGIFWNTGDPAGDGNKTQVGGIRRSSDNSYVTPDTPAARGEVIVIPLTGQGNNVNNPVANGDAPTDASSTTTTLPRVFVSGVEATVQFSGLMPGWPGLWQVNAYVPDEAFIKGAVPLIVTFNGAPANEVIFYVAE